MNLYYQLIIGKTSMDKDKVFEKVKDHLFNRPFDKQKMGLTNALEGATKANGTKLKKTRSIPL